MPAARTATVRISKHCVQWAAQFLVSGELARRGYLISFPLGNAPATDVHVTSPGGTSFALEVKGLQRPNFWLVKKPRNNGLRYYILALVPTEQPDKPPRYFILSNAQLLRIHQDDPSWPGFNWSAPLAYEGAWKALPQ